MCICMRIHRISCPGASGRQTDNIEKEILTVIKRVVCGNKTGQQQKKKKKKEMIATFVGFPVRVKKTLKFVFFSGEWRVSGREDAFRSSGCH